MFWSLEIPFKTGFTVLVMEFYSTRNVRHAEPIEFRGLGVGAGERKWWC